MEAFLFSTNNLASGGLFNECSNNVGKGLFNFKVNLNLHFDIVVLGLGAGLFKFDFGSVRLGVGGG